MKYKAFYLSTKVTRADKIFNYLKYDKNVKYDRTAQSLKLKKMFISMICVIILSFHFQNLLQFSKAEYLSWHIVLLTEKSFENAFKLR